MSYVLFFIYLLRFITCDIEVLFAKIANCSLLFNI